MWDIQVCIEAGLVESPSSRLDHTAHPSCVRRCTWRVRGGFASIPVVCSGWRGAVLYLEQLPGLEARETRLQGTDSQALTRTCYFRCSLALLRLQGWVLGAATMHTACSWVPLPPCPLTCPGTPAYSCSEMRT